MIGCGTNDANIPVIKPETSPFSGDTLQPDPFMLPEGFNGKDLPIHDSIAKKLVSIRKNFARINSIKKWASIDTVDIDTGEGGEAIFYYQNGRLEKIEAYILGETFQSQTDYYLKEGTLSFVFERMKRYNRPIYYDSAVMKQQHDTEVFDSKKSTIIETRTYFEKDKLIHQINNLNMGLPPEGDSVFKEQKRIFYEFNQLLKFSKT